MKFNELSANYEEEKKTKNQISHEKEELIKNYEENTKKLEEDIKLRMQGERYIYLIYP